jgi:ketosteroid isomerase-like protein
MLTDTMKAPTAQQDQAAILSLLENNVQAHRDKNAASIAASYAPDAAVFNLAPPLAHQGIDVKEKQAWLDSWDGPVEIEPRDMQVTVNGNIAFAHGYMRMAGRKQDAGRDIHFWMRETVCLERREGKWRIVHEHTSVPFYMDGMPRPAFDLQP